MRKWLIIVAILGLLFTSAYILFPREVIISHVEKFNCNIHSVSRFLMNENKWNKWWPGNVKYDSTTNKSVFEYGGYNYLINEYKYNAISIQTKDKNFSVNSSIYFIPLNVDTVQVEWKYTLLASPNPFNRIRLHWMAKKLHNNLVGVMKSMKLFLEKQVNIYGVDFYEEMSKDSTLVVTKSTYSEYPSTAQVYNLISKLKKYIADEGAKENNFPMLNVKKLDESQFETMVAISINKYLPGNNEIFFRRFVPWKMQAADVRGGSYTVEEALKQMKIYLNDHQKSAMALPFQSLVIDRSKQPDTLQWITRIYTPIP
ncbi:MAG: hypothetical protein ABI091_07485 [Ferruginibacter sp.]